jgi:hypothetical protein
LPTSGRCRARCATRAAGFTLAACLAASLAAGQGPAAGPPDYRAIFGERYADAERFLRDQAWMAAALDLPPGDARLALSVVFPELIRFSALEDQIQVRGLKVLYVQHGRSYADFSVGRFQMKPSFAEQLEADAARLFGRRERAATGVPAFERGDTATLRERRVRRLDDPRWQVRYLRLFMLVMGKRYAGVARSRTEDRLRFYATAYNTGYAAGETTIRRRLGRRLFHVARFRPAETYDYADVALSHFRGRLP